MNGLTYREASLYTTHEAVLHLGERSLLRIPCATKRIIAALPIN